MAETLGHGADRTENEPTPTDTGGEQTDGTARTESLWAHEVTSTPAVGNTAEADVAAQPEPAAQPAANGQVADTEPASVPPPPSWPPGWYDVPDRVNTSGYWDGQRWTGDFVPKTTPAGPPSGAVAPAGAGVSKNGLIVGLVGFALLIVGSLGPWATAAFASVSGTNGDGKLTLAAGVIGAVTLLPGGPVAVFSALVGLAGLGVSVYDIAHISDKASQFTLGGVQIIQVGWGLYVCAGGAVIAIIGAIMHRNITVRARQQQAAG